MSSKAQVGQPVQYFDTKGNGPFAATILQTAESYDPTKAAFDKRVPAGTEVTLRVLSAQGRRDYTREYVPQHGTPEHAQAIAWEQAHAAKPAEGEDAPEVTARSWKPLA